METELHFIQARARERPTVGPRHYTRRVQQACIDDSGIDELALPRAAPVVQRLQDPNGGKIAIAGIAKTGETPHRLAAMRHAAIFVLHAGQTGAGLVVTW